MDTLRRRDLVWARKQRITPKTRKACRAPHHRRCVVREQQWNRYTFVIFRGCTITCKAQLYGTPIEAVDGGSLVHLQQPITRGRVFSDAEEAVEYITQLYSESCAEISEAFQVFATDAFHAAAQPPKANYPFVGISVGSEDLARVPDHQGSSWGVLYEPATYGGTLTRPDVFARYYVEQLSTLIARYGVQVVVGLSQVPIPLPFAIQHSSSALTDAKQRELAQRFVMPDLMVIEDHLPNGTAPPVVRGAVKPLALFSAVRTDFSLQRLQHYTATGAQHFQGFILLTNYQRYIEKFVSWSQQQVLEGEGEYEQLVGPGDVVLADGVSGTQSSLDDVVAQPQMPAYHLTRKDGLGITMVDIGVGPSNAKTLTDHLAVLRPHVWLMLGHCAGLRITQRLGDYVLAHAYVREDHVLDQDLPLWVPVPPLAEVQVALQEAAERVMDTSSAKGSLRTGTLVTTDNRDWELRVAELKQRFNQSRAIAVDMESATIAANGFRLRVPYGTLLCVSDKPIHGELKLAGMANEFYKQRVAEHLFIGLEAMRILRDNGVHLLQSRKLRGFDEPPFR